MAVPKQKQSRSRTRKRRAAHKLAPVDLVAVDIDGVEHLVPRRLAAAVQRGLVDPTTGRPRGTPST